jgi:16S rRNA G966 N2-methylase RsmD
MSFEAASRGAERVLCVEQSAPAYRLLQATQEKLKATQIHLLRADAEKIARDLQARGEQFDIIFLDPPFHQGWAKKILPLAVCLLAPSGRLYWESDTALTDEHAQHYGLQRLRFGQAGQVHYHVLQKASPDFLNKEQIS